VINYQKHYGVNEYVMNDLRLQQKNLSHYGRAGLETFVFIELIPSCLRRTNLLLINMLDVIHACPHSMARTERRKDIAIRLAFPNIGKVLRKKIILIQSISIGSPRMKSYDLDKT